MLRRGTIPCRTTTHDGEVSTVLTSPIANREQLAEAIAQAKADSTGKSKWYVMRIAKAMRLENDLPPEWQTDAEKIAAVRRAPDPRERTVAESLARETADAVDSASPGDDVLAIAASASAQAMRNGDHDEFLQNFGAAIDELVKRDRLYGEDAAAIVAAARKVASAEGVRRYNKPIGTPLGEGGAATSIAKSASSVATLQGMPNSVKAGTKIVTKNADGTTSSRTLLHTEDDGDAVVLHATDSAGVIHKTRVPKNARIDTETEESNSSQWKSQSEKLAARRESLRKRMEARRSVVAAGFRKVRSLEGVRRYKLPIGTPLDGTHGDDAAKSVARIGDDKKSGTSTPAKVSLKPGESVYLTGPNKGKVVPSGSTTSTPAAKPAAKPASKPDRPKNWTAAYSPGSRMHQIDTKVAEHLAKELETTGYLSDHTEDTRLKQLDKLHGTNRYGEAKAKHAAKKAAQSASKTSSNDSSESKPAPRFKEEDVIADYIDAVKKNRKLREEGGSITQAQRARAEIDSLRKYMQEHKIDVPTVPRDAPPVAGADKRPDIAGVSPGEVRKATSVPIAGGDRKVAADPGRGAAHAADEYRPTPLKNNGDMELFHGGLPAGTTIEGVDVNRSGDQQRKRRRSFGGFYLTDESSRDWSDQYAKARGGTMHGFKISKNARIGEISDMGGSSNIDRISEEQRAHMAKSFDVIKGKDLLGRTQYLLLNRDVVEEVTETNVNDPSAKPIKTSPKTAAKAAEAVEAESAKPDAATPAPAAAKSVKPDSATSTPKSFVSGQQKILGKVNLSAKGQDPERFQPKTTLGDGHTQKVGDRVMHSDGRVGTVEQTYQTHTAVKWDGDGKKQTVVNTKLNNAGGSSSASATPAKATPAKATPAVKDYSSDYSGMTADQIDNQIGDLRASRIRATTPAKKREIDDRIAAAVAAKKTAATSVNKSRQQKRDDIDDQIGNLRTKRRSAKTASERAAIDRQIASLETQRRSGKA